MATGKHPATCMRERQTHCVQTIAMDMMKEHYNEVEDTILAIMAAGIPASRIQLIQEGLDIDVDLRANIHSYIHIT